MRSLSLATILTAILLSTPLSAETCLATGEFRWSATGTTVPGGAWAGCTPTQDDDFILDSADDYVRVEAATLDLNPGGTLDVQAGVIEFQGGTEIDFDTSITISGGTMRVDGIEVATGRISEPPAMDATTVTVTIDPLEANVDPAIDWIVYGDDDPDDMTATAGSRIFVGPGSDLSATRASLEKWRWYDIATSDPTTSRITYSQDACLAGNPAACAYGADGGGDLPYSGTRTNLVTANVALNVTSSAVGEVVRRRYGHLSRVTVAAGTLDANGLTDNDGTDQWLVFSEPTRCSGRAAKIVASIENGASADHLFVVGDLTACVGGTFQVHRGARRGDPVRIVRPVLFNGNGTGYFELKAGVLQGRDVYFFHHGLKDRTSESPALAADCAVCIFQTNAALAPDGSSGASYLIDYAIGWVADSTTPARQWAHLSFDAGPVEGERGGSRLGAGAAMNMSAFKLERGYIHDTLDETAAANVGGMGLAVYNTRGLTIDQHRIERVSDSCLFVAVGDGSTFPPAYGVQVRQTILLGCLADDVNQQNGLEIVTETAGIGGNNLVFANAGQVQVSDVFSVGAYWSAYRYLGLSSTATRSVFAGATTPIATPSGLVAETADAAFGCRALNDPVDCCSGVGAGVGPPACSLPVKAALTGPAEGSNLVVINSQTIGDTVTWSGFLRNSLIVGNPHEYTASLRQLGGLFGVFHDRGETGQTYLLRANSDDTQKVGLLQLEDTVLSGADATTLTHTEYVAGLAPIVTLEIQRTTLLMENTGVGGALVNTSNASVGVDLRGLKVTQEVAAGADDLGIDANSPVFLENVCVESTATRAAVYDSQETATTLVYEDLGPSQQSDLGLRAFVQDPTDLAICEQGKPLTLGLTELGVQHLMLGDLFVEQLAHWSSSITLE